MNLAFAGAFISAAFGGILATIEQLSDTQTFELSLYMIFIFVTFALLAIGHLLPGSVTAK